MKKIILLLISIFCLSGCVKVEELEPLDFIDVLATKAQRVNTFRTGFDYYLPQGMQVEDSNLFNEVISSKQGLFYLFVDAVSYHENIAYSYNETKEAYVSKKIQNGDKFGYLEINLLENAKYLIEIMYNYAKIEVIVDKEDLNISLLNAINILKSVELKDGVITNLLEDDILNYAEQDFNIFNTTSSDSDYITRDDSYISEDEETMDPDLIN